MSEADQSYNLDALRSQEINSIRGTNSIRSHNCSQPFAAAVEEQIVADHAVRGWAKVANTRSKWRSVLPSKDGVALRGYGSRRRIAQTGPVRWTTRRGVIC